MKKVLVLISSDYSTFVKREEQGIIKSSKQLLVLMEYVAYSPAINSKLKLSANAMFSGKDKMSLVFLTQIQRP